MNEQAINDIHKSIMLITTQDQLDMIIRTVKIRRKDLGRLAVADLSKGDKVFIDNRKGKAEHGIIMKVNRTRAVVKIDDKNWIVPFSLIQKET